MNLVPTCSANTVKLDVVFNESDDVSIRARIDYVCIGNDNEMVSGNFEHCLFTLIVTAATCMSSLHTIGSFIATNVVTVATYMSSLHTIGSFIATNVVTAATYMSSLHTKGSFITTKYS